MPIRRSALPGAASAVIIPSEQAARPLYSGQFTDAVPVIFIILKFRSPWRGPYDMGESRLIAAGRTAMRNRLMARREKAPERTQFLEPVKS